MAQWRNGITSQRFNCNMIKRALNKLYTIHVFMPLSLYTFFINFGPSKQSHMKILYNIGILIFTALAHLISPFNSKASLWVKGQKKWAEKIADKIKPEDRTVWIHCASLGEFEQGRPVIEAIKKEMSGIKDCSYIFFSFGIRDKKELSRC